MWPFEKIPNAERADEEPYEAEEDHSHIKDHDARDKDHQSRQSDEDAIYDHRYRWPRTVSLCALVWTPVPARRK